MKKFISFTAAVLALTFTFSQSALAFSDVSASNENYMEINWLAQNNVIKGYPDGTFKPDATVNRAELLKIVFLALGLQAQVEAAKSEMTAANIGFPDVKVDQWYAPYVYLAKKRGSVQGYPDGTFKPGNPVKRGEAFKIALNEFYNNQVQFNGAPQVTDVSASQWFWKYANFAAARDLFDGAMFEGGDNMTRGTTAELVYRTKTVKDNSLASYVTSSMPQAIVASGSTGSTGSTGGAGTASTYTSAELLAKVEAAFAGLTAVNIKQAGNSVFFLTVSNDDTPSFVWNQMVLTTPPQTLDHALYESQSPLNIERGAVSPDGREFLVTAEDGGVWVENTATHTQTQLGTFRSGNSARYISPAYTPDGRYLILLDQVDNALVVLHAGTKNFQSPAGKVSGFWLPEAGGGMLEHGYTYSMYTFLSADRVQFSSGGILNLSTMRKE